MRIKPKVCIGLTGMEGIFQGDIRDVIRSVKLAEDCGIDQVSLTDHVVMGRHVENYPYGKFPMPLDYAWHEPHTLLSAIAAITDTIRLSAGVIISPLRPTVLFAKQIATLDVISAGRVDIGVGTGWQREEFDASGYDYEKRFQILEDQIRACRRLWTERSVTLALETVKLDDIYCHPQPVQPRLPVWFGLKPLPQNARRIAELGDGWIPIGQDPGYIANGVEKLHRAFEHAGRSPCELTVRALPATVHTASGLPDLDATLASAEALVDAGADIIEVLPMFFARQARELEDVFRTMATLKG